MKILDAIGRFPLWAVMALIGCGMIVACASTISSPAKDAVHQAPVRNAAYASCMTQHDDNTWCHTYAYGSDDTK